MLYVHLKVCPPWNVPSTVSMVYGQCSYVICYIYVLLYECDFHLFLQSMLYLYLMYCRSHRVKIRQAGRLVLLHLVMSLMAAVMVG